MIKWMAEVWINCIHNTIRVKVNNITKIIKQNSMLDRRIISRLKEIIIIWIIMLIRTSIMTNYYVVILFNTFLKLTTIILIVNRIIKTQYHIRINILHYIKMKLICPINIQISMLTIIKMNIQDQKTIIIMIIKTIQKQKQKLQKWWKI